MSSMEDLTATEEGLVSEYARSALEDWHDEKLADDLQAAARRAIAKIKADAWDEGEQAGHWNTTERMGGPMNNPYR